MNLYSIGMKTFADKVLERRQALGLSQPELGKASGLSYQAIQQIEGGKSKSTRRLIELANALKVPADWLNSEDDVPAPGLHGAGSVPLIAAVPAERADFVRDVPVLEGAICGEDGVFEFDSQTADLAPRPPRLAGVRDAYALYVRGDSMEPWREHGKIVYVHPGVPVRNNDFVVVQLKPTQQGGAKPAYIKRLVGQTSKEVRLLQYNPRKYITFPANRVFEIHRVMDWDELLGS